MNKKNRIGAVLVVGGGIGGIQASLDLADSGFKVFLLEKETSIGGVMAQLDKTFPTNDCSMCILAPKLVSVARHPNIKVITNAEVESLTGEPGDFTATIRKNPRYVDEEKCTGCGDCAKVCPVLLPNEFDERLATNNAIYRLYPQAVPNAFKIVKRGMPPCKDNCPAGLSGQAYCAFIAQSKFKEAIEYIRGILPFPSICGRVCHHPCEDNCNRKDEDETVSIMRLKRFVADWVRDNGDTPIEKVEPTQSEKVAVIGAGPSGLSCAEKLLKKGYPVTVFDSSSIPGGMMTSCIPEYRLSRQTALYDIKRLFDMGIEFKGETTLGKNISLSDLINSGFKAIFIGIGVQQPKKLRINGLGSKNVHYGIPFLKSVKEGKPIDNFGRNIIVIGGGNVAIDCARTALRLGGEEIHLVCLETRDLTSKDRMPAHDWEILEAEEEGVLIHPSLGPKGINVKDSKITGLETVECIAVYDKDGKFKPKFKPDSRTTTISGDTIIIAIGQDTDISGFEDLAWDPRKTLKIDPITLETNIPGIFAGGDIVRGPSSIIESVADGNEAAISIDRYLKGEDLKKGRTKAEAVLAEKPEKDFEKTTRQKVKILDPALRKKSWDEIEFCFSPEQAIEEAKRCMECGVCSSCYLCVDACKADAIDHMMREEIIDINVGSVILALGFDEFDAKIKSEYGYGRYENVVTSIEFERILSASGPFEGHVLRPGDKKEPRKIAFVQCVGSRDPQAGSSYCSSVCCTYAIKEAIIAKEHAKNKLETTIFCMDIRTFGKGFESYYQRAKGEHGVKFVRAGISKIDQDPKTMNPIVHYESEAGEIKQEQFDMVVLSVGLTPKQGAAQLAKKLRLNLNEHGFCRTSEFMPVDTLRDGVYVCGAFAGPKDIPETVTQASGAASKAMSLLAPARNTLTARKEYPPELDVTNKEPRIGVFICHCGINIGGYIDVPSIVEYTKTLSGVVYAEDNLYTCSQDTQKRIVETIKEHQLNRIIVASCTPRTHEPLFHETIREAGLNPYLFEMVNIRDQCSWIHMKEPEGALEKAKDLVRMAVAKARLLMPLKRVEVDVIQKALVIGGGLAGMVSSISLAKQGFEVFLVEKEDELGGNLRHIYQTIEGRDVQEFLRRTVERIKQSKLIKTFTGASIESVAGCIGNYETEILLADGSRKTIKHGVVIAATGAREYEPQEYYYGKYKNVVTQKELEEILVAGTNGRSKTVPEEDHRDIMPAVDDISSVVMIQCIGSRDNSHAYCSRICCSQAVKNALKLIEINPKVNIYILYRDMRTYGYKEDFYRKAREAGVVFIRYDEDSKPELITDNGRLNMSVLEPILQERIKLSPDIVVLSTGIEPNKENERLAKILKVPLNDEGFFLEAHVKLRPVDFATEGVFVAGMAHSPKCIDETISQAEAAVARAVTIIANEKYYAEAVISHVDEELCAGCGICSSLCAYEAIEIVTEAEKRKSKVNEALCKGCGTCVAACPSGAMDQYGFTKKQIMAMVDAIF